MSGAVDRYWPTPAAYALTIICVDCGVLAFSCPCAVADNEATGQGDDAGCEQRALTFGRRHLRVVVER